jgi:hypothetical protein
MQEDAPRLSAARRVEPLTATAGAQVVRTDRYPQDMHGDLFPSPSDA